MKGLQKGANQPVQDKSCADKANIAGEFDAILNPWCVEERGFFKISSLPLAPNAHN